MEGNKYYVGPDKEAQERYELTKKYEANSLKPGFKPPFVNLPITTIKENYKENVLLDDKNINNIKYIGLKSGGSLGCHWHKENFHFVILMKGILNYYEKPLENTKGVFLDRIKIGQMFYIPPMVEHDIFAEENDSQFYIFSHKSLEKEKIDTFKSSYDIKNFPLISRESTPSEIQYIKRFSYERN